MSKRVYEIARELDLSTKEVLDRLNDAGIEVKSHFAVVEDPVYERVFGDALEGATPNSHSEVHQDEAIASMSQSPRKRLLARGVLAYVLLAALTLAVAAGVGAMVALMMRSDPGLPASKEPQQPEEQANSKQSEQQGNAKQNEKQGNAKQSEAEYVSKVGEIQSRSVETFLDSHHMLMRYDLLTADDVEQLQANQATLKDLAGQVDGLNPPQKYREQYEVFRSAINELYEAAKLAYTLAADPIAATKSKFDEHDRHVDRAAARLQQSNEILGRDFKTIEGARMEEVSPF